MTNYITEIPAHIKAVYKPRPGISKSSRLDDCSGKTFKFSEARSVNGERKFWPVDKNFPHSAPVSEYDIQIIDDLLKEN